MISLYTKFEMHSFTCSKDRTGAPVLRNESCNPLLGWFAVINLIIKFDPKFQLGMVWAG